ncbi:gene transfer agent family protein [Sinorhizobium medicae]|uniref:gene transfer agent family protein n=1 Tax=Sinorhizobium medicae TaxID=110321 RepID=UPI001297515A|nr:gene transfer agent family protein [Sinorhizobium medicae]MDX0487537.1 gene transfer agent family protein [Sinorhizobium medicae]MDX0498970.1 gene transfer agent family protein [Sinorhizobium medicae]MDX0530701.1 gene transfer agent family protein [Sinorhizobium medicae]MDX0574583.1 gene transfer agent family protein [Sinorhizobium medicae]MDX0673367.1 gene transfer agent family protein [Sinorhizobium medicae]
MSRDGSCTVPFNGQKTFFKLAWRELMKIQEACDAGPYVVLDRLVSGRWKLQDISEVIKWGLIGGGMPQGEALKLVENEVECRPPLENLAIAQQVLAAGVVGAPEEEVGKKSAAVKQKTRSRTGKSALPLSSETA